MGVASQVVEIVQWSAVRYQKTEATEKNSHRPFPRAQEKHKARQTEKARPRDVTKGQKKGNDPSATNR